MKWASMEHDMKQTVFRKTHLLPPGFSFLEGFLFGTKLTDV